MASSKSFFSLLAGLAAGAAFGILYAPDKGWKTRARVKKAAANGYEDLKENLGDLGAKVDEKAAQAKASLKDIRETLRTKGAEIKEDTRDMLLKQLERGKGRGIPVELSGLCIVRPSFFREAGHPGRPMAAPEGRQGSESAFQGREALELRAIRPALQAVDPAGRIATHRPHRHHLQLYRL